MISFQVNDMTCGHCASAIGKAVAAIDKHAKVNVDLANHRVEIEASDADAQALQGLPGVKVLPPQSNILFVDLAPEKAVGAVDRLRAAGVLCNGLHRLRLVTHLDVSGADVQRAIAVLRASL